MKKLIFILLLFSFGIQAQNIDPLEGESIKQNFINLGGGIQTKRTSIDLGIGWRNNNVLILSGIAGGIYHLENTYAYEYNFAVKINSHYHFLNYGFLNSWSAYGKKRRWTPYINLGLAVGTRYIQNHHLIIYHLNRWNFLLEMEGSVGIKWSPKDIFGWHTNEYLTMLADVGMINSNLEGKYPTVSLGINYVLGY